MKKRTLISVLSACVIGAGIGAGAIHSNATNVLNSSKTYAAEAESTITDATMDTTDTADSSDSTDTDVIPTVSLDSSSSSGYVYSNVADVAEAVMPSVVAITNKSVQEVQGFFRGQTYQYESTGAGSGIIVGENDTELLICTNNHVVEDATELTVTFTDDSSYEAQIKGTDADNDLAVVAVKLDDLSEDTKDAIKIAKIGDSDSMRVGEQVVAIGNALGYGQSVTTGIVSVKDATRTMTDSETGQEVTYEDLIQTDAAINPGNSGGALVNMNGEVIGINTAKMSTTSVEGIGYAISIDKAMPILEDLMSRETREKVSDDERGYLGINGQSVPTEVVQLYGLPEGVYLTTVASVSPAADAGLQEGDIITEIAGEEVTSMDGITNVLQYYKAGEEVEVTYYTQSFNGGYTEKTATVTLGARSDIS